jgi:predicted porin
MLDLGAQLKLDVTTKFTLSLEAVYRTGFDNRFANTYKINALAQYKFSKNRLIFVSFGNELNETTDTGPDQLVMNIGLNLGFGDNVTIKRVNMP